MAPFPYQIIGFDLDGTLLDTHRDLGAAVTHALALAGRPPVPPQLVRDLIGGGARRMLERALQADGPVLDEHFDRLFLSLLDYYEAHIAVHTHLFPGGEAMLADLAARGVRMAVVTNKLEHLAIRLIDELGLSDHFFAIIGGDTLGPGRAKPAPDLLDEMVARGGGGRAAYVGDSTFDTLAARAAGLPCIAVSFGFNDLPAAELGADAVIDHFDQLVPTLTQLAKADHTISR
jgi:phosphoglycolate phosphatase